MTAPTARTVLVTGGSKGIGRAIAEAFAEQGHRVAVTYNTSPPLAGVHAVKCNVADQVSVDEAFADVEANLGPVEVLVSNAGITADKLLMRMTDEQFFGVIETNLGGAMRVARRAIPGMLRAKWGRMIFVSSVVGVRGEKGQANYAASKAGLIGLARSLARELGGRNITSNVVAPGLVATDMVTSGMRQAQIDALVSQIPCGRIGQPEDIANAVLWIAGDGTSYLNGAVIPLDGGAAMGH